MLDTYNQNAHRKVAITVLAGISSRNHYFVCEERTNYLRKYMIAKIYPDGHPDLQGKKDPTHPVRYFDIRKLTPVECYSLMGVPPPIYREIDGHRETALYGLCRCGG